MKNTLLLLSVVALLSSCTSKKVDDLDCPCTIIAKQEPVYNMTESSLGEVIVEDKHGKLHTFSFQSDGTASLKNQEVGYRFGGGVSLELQNDTLIKVD